MFKVEGKSEEGSVRSEYFKREREKRREERFRENVDNFFDYDL
jgi:hypothetical protein